MSVEKSFSVTLEMILTESGSFESIRLLKGRSQLPDDVLERANEALQDSLVPAPPIQTTVGIGDHAEQKIMNHLLNISKVNMDFNVVDTSSQTGHGDVAVTHQSKRFCIEVKTYSKLVPMKEIDKYHQSLKLAEYDAGITIQANSCGYTREANLRSPIDMRIPDGKPTVYHHVASTSSCWA